MDDHDETFPPLSPAGERAAPDDFNFVQKCLCSLDKLTPLGPIEPGRHTLTESERWGVVLRVDFTINQKPALERRNRAVFWHAKNGTISEAIAIGQEIPPLNGI